MLYNFERRKFGLEQLLGSDQFSFVPRHGSGYLQGHSPLR
jgi:hypothetical protein